MHPNYFQGMRDKDLEEELARFVKRKNVKEEFSQRLTESSRRSFLRLRFRTDGRSITTEQLERVSRELQLFWNLPPSLPPKFGGFNYSAMRFPRINWQKGNETVPVSQPILGQAVERWSLTVAAADHSHWQMLQDLQHNSPHITSVCVKEAGLESISIQIEGFGHKQGEDLYKQYTTLGMFCTLVRHADTEVRLEHSVGFNLQQHPKETKVNTNPHHHHHHHQDPDQRPRRDHLQRQRAVRPDPQGRGQDRRAGQDQGEAQEAGGRNRAPSERHQATGGTAGLA